MKAAPLFVSVIAAGVLSLVGGARALGEVKDAAGVEFFEKKIRPVLAEKCYKCHSAQAEKIKGGLVLDTREGTRRGGDNGPAVVPGDVKGSLLMEAVRYENKDFAMPPKKSGGKLDEAVIKDFEKWIAMGAPDPREEKAASGALTSSAAKQENWGAAKDWWAWQRPAETAAPAPKTEGWARTEIDRFLLSAMEEKGVKPVADADKLTLLRRVYFDLVGLPPTPADVKAFYADSSDAAYEALVDKLLASPQYGERWGRHWLDVARYAESSGKDANISFPHAWRYRDYVIAAFNADKPYDEFIREQLAGDQLPAKDDKEKAEHIVATGFLAIGPKGLNEQNPRQFVLDLADEQIDATSQAFLGMTVACARCHDHKFDPIPQKEYYSLAGIFLSTETKYGTAQGVQNRHATGLVELPKGAGAATLNKTISASEQQRKQTRLAELKKEQLEIFQSRGNGGAPPAGQNQLRFLRVLTETGLLEKDLGNYDESGQMKALAMAVQDLPATRPGMGGFGGGPFGGPGMFGGRPGFGRPGGFGGPGAPGGPNGPGGAAAFAQQRLQQRFARPPEFQTIADSAVYTRGDADKAGEKTPRGFLSLLTTSTPPSIAPGTSGRRELAEWIASPQNPLTTRVMVNRVWHWAFGDGIVTTPDNFGTTGNKPSNQALLDTLAVQFAQQGWSVKKLVREIVLSHAYRLSSMYDEQNFAIDPENTLGWRMNKRRLDAESIRDAILFTSGQLVQKPYVGSVIAYAGDGPVGQARLFGVSEEAIVDSGSRSNLRSVYLPIARDILPDVLAVFDFSEPSLVSGSRESTNVPVQALYLLNSPFVANAAEKFAERVMNTYPAGPNGGIAVNLDQRVTMAYWMAYSRGPTGPERRAAGDFFAKFPASWKPGDAQAGTVHDAAAIKAAWTSFCRALFASAEFRYLN